ncbi:MAG: hypothetical protein KTR25_07825 [Myxococcales bacterium]|nr:hypothetical protein [Myxococcales bacterium]
MRAGLDQPAARYFSHDQALAFLLNAYTAEVPWVESKFLLRSGAMPRCATPC